MLYNVSEFIVLVLFLPVLMNLIFPLGMLAGWLVMKLCRFVTGNSPGSEKVRLTAQGLPAR